MREGGRLCFPEGAGEVGIFSLSRIPEVFVTHSQNSQEFPGKVSNFHDAKEV